MVGRWVASFADRLARGKGVRVLCVDRPGMGGTDAVPVDQRLAVWLGMNTSPSLPQNYA